MKDEGQDWLDYVRLQTHTARPRASRRAAVDDDNDDTAPRSPRIRLERRRLASELAHDRRERLWIDAALHERDEHGELFAIETRVEELGDVVRDVERFSRRVRHVGARATAWARAGVCGGSSGSFF